MSCTGPPLHLFRVRSFHPATSTIHGRPSAPTKELSTQLPGIFKSREQSGPTGCLVVRVSTEDYCKAARTGAGLLKLPLRCACVYSILPLHKAGANVERKTVGAVEDKPRVSCQKPQTDLSTLLHECFLDYWHLRTSMCDTLRS